MKQSKVFLFIGVFLLAVMDAGVSWVIAKSEVGSTTENAVSSHAYLPVVLQPVAPNDN